MYSYIKGTIAEIGLSNVVIDNHGIGYFIAMARPEKYHIGEEQTIYVYQYIREDENSLYGFVTKEEKELFLKLINVKGVGCKMALGMFTGAVDGIIEAIEKEDISYLKKFPKVGEKVARQIILDLKGKLVSSMSDTVKVDHTELIEALKALGYKAQVIQKILPKIDAKATIEVQIKEALKLL